MTTPWGARPDRGSPPHDRATALLVERLDGPLEADEATWLDDHLSACRACWALGEAFEADRVELRALRRQPVEPPRDLWARTAAALEQEARSGARRAPRRRPSPAPVGAAAGLLVVAVVIGASMLSGRQSITPTPPSSPSVEVAVISPTPADTSAEPTVTVVATPEPTPLSIPSGDVGYIALDDQGNKVFLELGVSEVCSTNGAECAPLQPSTPRVLNLPNSPEAVIKSPNDEQFIVVEEGSAGDGGTMVLVAVPTPVASGGTPTDQPTATPETPTATPSLASDPATTAPTTASPDIASPTATAAITESPTATATATATAGPFAIAEDVVIDGSTAAFSPDGRYFAFTARPADGAHGPDIYLWASDGVEPATPLTDDHRSVFAGWLGDSILGSRVVAESGVEPVASAAASPSPAAPSSPDASASPDASGPASDAPASDVPLRGEAFLVDAASGEVVPVPDRALWRPSVDPTGSRAVYWDGSLTLDEAGNPVVAVGRLVIGSWAEILGPEVPADPSASADPSAGVDPDPTSPLPSPDASASPADATVDVLAEGPLVDWDAQWDETGTHLAVWIADPDDPSTGKLSLYVVDPETGRLEADAAPLRDARALPGFAIGQGKLVWATPPGQNAEGSHVSVLAWTDDGVGQVESHPADEIVVIR